MMSLLDPGQIIKLVYDSATEAIKISGSISTVEGATAADGAALPAEVKVVAGYDGAAVQVIKTDANGELQVDVLSSALPTGASTAANQATGNASLASIDSKIPASPSQEHTTAGSPHSTRLTDGTTFYKATTPSDTQPISAASLPLPTGASSASNQTNGSQKSQIVDGSGNVIGATSNALDVHIKSGVTLEVNLDNANDDVLVYGYDGAVNRALKTDASGELQVDVLSSALPSGASTLAEQQTQTTSLQLLDDTVATTGSAVPLKGFAVSGSDGTDARLLKTDSNGELQVDVLSSALPTGAATSALQLTGNTSLSSIDGKLRSFDLDSGAGTENVQGVSLRKSASGGSVELGTSSDPVRTDPTGITAQPVTDNGGSLTVDGTVAATQSGTWNITNVTGTISLPTGASTLAEQQSQTTSLQLLDDTVATSGAAITAKGFAAVGTDGTNARILKTDASGELQIDVLSSALPSGAATSANQTNKAQYTRLTDGTDDALVTAAGELNVIATAQPGVDIGDVTVNNAAGASAVNIQDGGNSITVDGTVAATQSGTWTVQPGNTANTTPWLSTINQGGNSATVTGANALKVDGSAVTQPVSGTVTAAVSTINSNAITATTRGSKIGLDVSELGYSMAHGPQRWDYTTPITTAAYTQIVASLANDVQEVEIFDSSGQTLLFATGAAASEVNQFIIFPGGNGRVKLRIAAGTRISVKALSADATAGELDINFYGN